MKQNTTLGLDLGIASIGAALFQNDKDGNPCKVITLESLVFDQVEDGKTGKTENVIKRAKRLMRRQEKRKKRRLSDTRDFIKENLGLDFFEVEETCSRNITPFELKAKGLSEKLSEEELARVLYHYMKHRGFKSNRKVFDNDSSNPDKKMLIKYKETEDKLAKYSEESGKTYVSQMVCREHDFSSIYKTGEKVRNGKDGYVLNVTRKQYQEEIEALLDKQISYGLIDNDFKGKYLAIWTRQRDFSEGPSEHSPYHSSIEDRIGLCEYDGNQRAAKDSYSAKMFVLLSSLNNLLYKEAGDTQYKKLTPEQICKIADEAIWKSTFKYSQLFHLIGLKSVEKVKGLDLTRKQYGSFINKFFEKHPTSDGEILKDLGDPRVDQEEYNDSYHKAVFDKTFFSSSELLNKLHSKLGSNTATECEKKRSNNHEFYDEVADILLKNKTDESITKECLKKGYEQIVIDNILEQKDVTKVINLSTQLCSQIIPCLRQGLNYDESLSKCVPDYKKNTPDGVQLGRIPDIDTALKGASITLTNPAVKHTLIKMRTLVNAIIDKYGCPTYFAIELGRELKKSFEDRREIRNEQLDNQANNIRVKTEMLEKYPNVFSSVAGISKDDLIKYKLFKEQRGISPYTSKPIDERKLFDKKYYEVDHVVPYSLSFNDSFNNKVLVEAEENQKKGNRTPFEYLGSLETIESFINQVTVPFAKRNSLRTKHFDSSNDDFTSKDAGDNSYIAVLARKLILFYLVGDVSSSEQYCRTVSGGMTSKAKQIWGLSGHTHSYLADYEHNYRVKSIDGYILTDLSFVSVKKAGAVEEDSNEKSLQFSFTNSFDLSNKGNVLNILVQKKKLKELEPNKKVSPATLALREKIIKENRIIETFEENIEHFQQVYTLDRGGNLNIYQLYERSNTSSDGTNDRRDAAYFVLGLVLNQLYDTLNKKDRSNDLHHALDAAAIACITPTAKNRISNYFKDKENHLDHYNNETGEIGYKIAIPFPYEGFKDEVLARVYERDEDKLLSILNSLPQYKLDNATKENTWVLVPTRLPVKIKAAAISKETVYGKIKNSGHLFSRTPVSKLTRKDLENIANEDGGSTAIIKACQDWFDTPAKLRTPFPTLAKKGTPIKEVKLLISSDKKSKVDLTRGYADNDTVVRVDFYKKKDGDGRLIAVPIYYYHLSRERIIRQQKKRGQTNVLSSPIYQAMWAQSERDRDFLSYEELESNYIKVCSLPRYSLIEITMNTGKSFLAYSGGVTSGTFEVYSLLGDNIDIVSNGSVYPKETGRVVLTISTIKSIKARSISVLGKIS